MRGDCLQYLPRNFCEIQSKLLARMRFFLIIPAIAGLAMLRPFLAGSSIG